MREQRHIFLDVTQCLKIYNRLATFEFKHIDHIINGNNDQEKDRIHDKNKIASDYIHTTNFLGWFRQ